MPKRENPDENSQETPRKGGPGAEAMDVDNDMGDFEDQFEDEFESDDEIIEAGVDGRPDAEREAEEKNSEFDIENATELKQDRA